MGASPEFWHAGDSAEARFLAEHGAVGGFEGDEFVVSAGNAELLPAWPFRSDLPGANPANGDETEDDEPHPDAEPNLELPEPEVDCAVCGTPLRRRGDAGWRHEVGLAERGGCQTPWPEG